MTPEYGDDPEIAALIELGYRGNRGVDCPNCGAMDIEPPRETRGKMRGHVCQPHRATVYPPGMNAPWRLDEDTGLKRFRA